MATRMNRINLYSVIAEKTGDTDKKLRILTTKTVWEHNTLEAQRKFTQQLKVQERFLSLNDFGLA